MGISDDIVPKSRHSHYRSHPYLEPASSTEEVLNVSDDTDESAGAVEDKADTFFENRPTPTKVKKPARKRKFFMTTLVWKWVLGILMVLLIGFILFSNFKSIKSIFIKETPKTSSDSASSTEHLETYASEINPQDYTAAAPASSTATTQDTANTTTNNTTNKSALKIRLLNGNGIANSASSARSILETAGFTIASVGNASNFNYQSTIVYYKTGQEAGANLVKDALATMSVTIENSDSVVKTYDIVVVIGKS